MDIWFHPAKEIESLVKECGKKAGFPNDFDPQVRPADPRFGDFQANGVLACAKALKANPRALAQKLADEIKSSPDFDGELIEVSVAGPGFLNFALTKKFLKAWLAKFKGEAELKSAAGKF